MKVLVLGRGVSGDGVVMLFDKYKVNYDYLNKEEVNSFNYLYVVKAPGIPMDDSIILAFLKLGIDVVTDIWVAMKYSNKMFIGITGSNGKTTTTLLVEHILKSKYKVKACGNIGYSVCKAVLDEDIDIFIVELSSFQLECVKINLDISILLNINYCHMDHHKSLDEYINSKKNIFSNQTKDKYLIYCYELCEKFVKDCDSNRIVFSNKYKSDVYYENDSIYYQGDCVLRIGKVKEYMLYNYMAAICCCKLLGINNEIISENILNFEEVKYRCNKINDYIYNDAKSTNPYSTIASLKELDNIFLICGGYDRGECLEGLDSYIDKIKCVFCYGMSKDKIYRYFSRKEVTCFLFDDLKEAFLCALENRKNEIILYSPMFASFDMFASYEQRGELFVELCRKYL